MGKNANKTVMKNITSNTEIVDDIIINCDKGIVTTNSINNSIARYLKQLYNPDDIYCNKPMIFNGLLEYIYKHDIKRLLDSNTVRYNWKLLDDIFEGIYINLCYTFSYVPMVTTFCNHLVHIDITYIYNIKDGIRLMDDVKVNPNIVNYIQKWINICDGDLFNHITQSNSVGGMFYAKVRGYSDQPQQINVNVNDTTPKIDLTSIAKLAGTLPTQIPRE